MLDNLKKDTELLIGEIIETIPIQGHYISYTIKFENLIKTVSQGIPLFQFGYNSYTYPIGSRVLVVVINGKYTSCYILGRVYNPDVLPNFGATLPREGELVLNSGHLNNSGISGIGSSEVLKIFNNKSNLVIKPDGLVFSFEENESQFSFTGDSFYYKLKNNDGFIHNENFTTLVASNGFNISALKNGVYIEGERFVIKEKRQKLQSKPEAASKEPKPSLEFDRGVHTFRGFRTSFEYSASMDFKIGTPKLQGGSTAVSWSVTEGDYEINLTSGELNLNCLDPTSAAFNVKIGPQALPISQMKMDTTELSIKLGPTLPSSLTLDFAEFKVEAGIISPDILQLGKGSLKIEAGSALIGITNSLEFSILSGITLKAGGLLSKGKIELDGDVTITGELIVKDKIFSTDEVFAKATVVAGSAITATAIGLSTHLHPTAIPGGPSSPTIGT
jgi:hypothetical protein